MAANVLAHVLLLLRTTAAASLPPLYKDASAPIEQRVADLMARMTVQEKVTQTYAPYSKFDLERFAAVCIGVLSLGRPPHCTQPRVTSLLESATRAGRRTAA
eukprot:COSAG01_NODE_246_length_20450_cov_195.166822_31_plen_102_part_00